MGINKNNWEANQIKEYISQLHVTTMKCLRQLIYEEVINSGGFSPTLSSHIEFGSW
jgi:hypothetical protein